MKDDSSPTKNEKPYKRGPKGGSKDRNYQRKPKDNHYGSSLKKPSFVSREKTV